MFIEQCKAGITLLVELRWMHVQYSEIFIYKKDITSYFIELFISIGPVTCDNQ